MPSSTDSLQQGESARGSGVLSRIRSEYQRRKDNLAMTSHNQGHSPSKTLFRKRTEAKIQHTREDSMFVRLLVIQWNLHNKMPEDMNQLIPNHGNGMDLIILGLQESTYSFKDIQDEESDDDELLDPPSESQDSRRSKRSLFHEISSRRRSLKDALEPSYNHMIYLIEQVIAPEFTLVKHVRRSQMQLIIYCRHAIRKSITNIKYCKENTGFLNVFPNKGGLSVSMAIRQTTFTFISCHLTAKDGPSKCAQRNDSLEEILRGARFGDKCYDSTLLSHHTIILGDLNYRITFDPRTPAPRNQRRPSFLASSSISFLSTDQQINQVLQMIENEEWEELLKHDELSREISAGRALSGFTALKPEFPPTFKRIRGKSIEKYIALSKAASIAIDAANEINSSTQFRHRLDYSGGGSHLPQSHQSRKMFLDPNWGAELMRKSLQSYRHRAIDRSIQRNFKNNGLLLKDASGSKDTDPAPIDIVENKATEDDRDAGVANGLGGSEFFVTNRMPSFTDRILYKSFPRFSSSEHIKALFFESCEGVSTSDHKPVRACFEITVDDGVHGIMVPKTSRRFVLNGLPLTPAEFLRMRPITPKQSSSAPLPSFLRVRISGLIARDLAVKDSADPYIVVTADPHQILRKDSRQDISSSFESRTCNPVWRDETIDFDICTVDLQGLSKHAHLIVSVFDHNKSKSTGFIGATIISMMDVIGAYLNGKEAYEFTRELYNNAINHGEICGTIQLIPASDDKDVVCDGISIADLFEMSPHVLQMSPEHNLGSVRQKTKSDSKFLFNDGDQRYCCYPLCSIESLALA